MSTAKRYPAAYRFLAGLIKPVLWVFFSKEWRGTENLRRPDGFIVAANHVSQMDPVTTAHVLYNTGAAPKIMAKDSLWKVPVLGWFLRKLEMIPVVRGSRRAGDSLVAAREALEVGQVVLIFPEGTLTQDPDSWPMMGHTGVARLALTSGKPVIPLSQWGAIYVLPKGGALPKLFPRRTMRAVVGPEVDLDDLREKPLTGSVLHEATQRIMAAITAGVAELRGEEPPAQPFDPRRSDKRSGWTHTDGSPAEGNALAASAGEATAGEVAEAAEAASEATTMPDGAASPGPDASPGAATETEEGR